MDADWTKDDSRPTAAPRRTSAICKGRISARGRFFVGTTCEITGPYPKGSSFASAMPISGERALSWSGRTSRLGRGNVPHDAANGRIDLKPTQQRVLAFLADGEPAEVTRGRYEELAGVSRSQAAYDLAELVQAGILERLGSGRATRYRLVRRSHQGQRRWTSELIRSELESFCAGRKTWPAASAFKDAGRADLYVAASRYGGIAHWASELGFSRPSRAAAAEAPEARVWRKFAWAGAGALAASLVAAVAAAFVVLNLPRGSTQIVSAAPHISLPAAAIIGRIAHASVPSLRSARTHVTPVKKRLIRTRPHVTVQRQTAPTESASTSSSASLISYSAPPQNSRSGTSQPAESRKSTPAPTPSAGPTPLRAPLAASAPSPLKAP